MMLLPRHIIVVLASCLICPIVSLGQQVSWYSMYMQNFYAINPAATGLEDHLDATMGYRKQWIGFANSPQTYFISANMPLTKTFQNPANSALRISAPDKLSLIHI